MVFEIINSQSLQSQSVQSPLFHSTPKTINSSFNKTQETALLYLKALQSHEQTSPKKNKNKLPNKTRHTKFRNPESILDSSQLLVKQLFDAYVFNKNKDELIERLKGKENLDNALKVIATIRDQSLRRMIRNFVFIKTGTYQSGYETPKKTRKRKSKPIESDREDQVIADPKQSKKTRKTRDTSESGKTELRRSERLSSHPPGYFQTRPKDIGYMTVVRKPTARRNTMSNLPNPRPFDTILAPRSSLANAPKRRKLFDLNQHMN